MGFSIFGRLALIGLLIGLTFTVLSGPALAQSFTDKDWTATAVSNCALPSANGAGPVVDWTMVQGDRKLAFRLSPGQVGGCSTDNQKRHNAPFWERAELRQKGYFASGQITEISFEATFLEGFTGSRETFFQIHGWADNCPAYPPLMMKFDRGVLRVDVLTGVRQSAGQSTRNRDKGRHRAASISRVRIASLYGRPQMFKLRFDARAQSPGTVSIDMNGRALLRDAPIEFASCARPHVKFGIYRPGKGVARSVVLFDDIRVLEN